MIEIKNIQGNVIYSTEINKGAKRKFQLMKEDYITLPFSLEAPLNFGLGSYVDIEEGLFEVVDLQKPTLNNSTGGYDYQLRLDAYYWKWKNKIFKFTPEVGGQEASWSLTASLDVHLGVFLKNLKALGYNYRGIEFNFSIDATVENKAMPLTYNNTNMIDALSAMAEAWQCEWWIEEEYVCFGRCERGESTDFEIGVNVTEMTASASQSTYATRLYAFGSTRNIPANYRPTENETIVGGVVQKRLMLPKGTPYVDAFEGMTEEEAIEEVVIFEDVYPKMNASIDSVSTYDNTAENEDGTTTTETFYRFKDNDITFSKDYILEGEELKVQFTSGSLNGMEFGLVFNPEGKAEKNEDGSWNPEAQLFEVVANEDYGRKLPDSTLNPKVGDTFILIGWDSTKIEELGLVAEAEQKLLEETLKLSAKRKIDPSTYNCKMSSVYMYGTPMFMVGDRVNLINSAFFKDGRQSRIVGFEYNLDIPFDSPVFIVGETLAYSRIGDLENKIDSIIVNGVKYEGNDVNLNRYLRKDRDDRSRGLIASDKGFEVGKFQEGVLGTGAAMYQNAEKATFVETDFLTVRKKAFFTNITVQELKHVGGVVILSPAAMICSMVEETTTGWKCYFNTKDADGRRLYNEFEVGDQARCQTFNLEQQADGMMGNRYYWRLVKEVGEDFIVLSKTDYDASVPNDIPQEGDNICQLGNRNDSLRQNAIIISAYGTDAPSFKQYKGIKSYDMADAELVTKLSPFGNEIKGKFISEDGTDIKDELDDVRVDWDKVLEQTDKEFTIWYYDYAPTLNNKPAVDWTTDELKELHEEDLFYDTKTGFAYRFERVLKLVDGLYQYVYQWSVVSDSETIKALQAAAKAQDTADGKRRVFVAQPTPPYDAGDQWVNATYGELFDDDDLVCATPKAEGEEFSIADWRPVSYGRTSVIKNMEGEIQLIANAFELGADGNLYLKNEAGMKITAEMAKIYATQTSLDLLGNKVDDLSSEIDVTAERIDLFTQKFSFDSDGNVTNINTSGLVTTSDFSTMFAQSVVDNNLVARAELSVFVKTDLNGNVSSGVYINADNVRINGITDIGSNKVSIGGFTINSDYMQAGVSTASGIMTLSATTLGFKEDGGMHVLIGPGAFGSAGEVGLYSNAPSGGFSVWGIGGAKMVARETNSEMVLIGGLALTYKYGNSFTYPANSPSGTTGAWADFLVMNGNASLPSPSTCPGKVLYVKCKSGSTLSVPNGIDSEGASKTSWSDGRSRFFISNKDNWYEFYCS